MADTRISLILRLQNDTPRSVDWSDFVACYGPVIYRTCRSKLSQDADAQDATQEVITHVYTQIRKYEPKPGCSFAGWLLTLTRHKLSDLMRKWNRQVQGSGRTTINEKLRSIPAAGDDSDGVGPQELLCELLQEAQTEAEADYGMDFVQCVQTKVEPTAWRFFLLITYVGLSVTEFADLFDLPPSDVNAAVAGVRQQLIPEVLRKADARTKADYSAGAAEYCRLSVENRTWNAFLLANYASWGGVESAALLGMSPAAFYVAVGRVRKALATPMEPPEGAGHGP